jgi:hypothetical protein
MRRQYGMAIDDLKKLDSIDLSKISVSDVRQLKNDALKRSLMDAIGSKQTDDSHQQHISHTDHVTAPENKDPATVA